VVCAFESTSPAVKGPFVLTLVGATIVGSMATTWHGVVNPPRGGAVREWRYGSGHKGAGKGNEGGESPAFKQGDEMGRFLLGSTVVMLFPKGDLKFNRAWASGRAIRLGEAMAGSAG
jgi:phosphatidylserine decarboxylase